MPAPVEAPEAGRRVAPQAERLRVAHECVRVRMFRLRRDAGRRDQRGACVDAVDGGDVDDFGAADGERAGLVDDEAVDGGEAFQCRGVPEQDARLRCPPGRDHHGHRRGEAQGTGAGDDEHRDGVPQAEQPA